MTATVAANRSIPRGESWFIAISVLIGVAAGGRAVGGAPAGVEALSRDG